MARVTVEDCIEKVPNRFGLVLMAGHRARSIANGAALTIDRDNDKNPVVALREIADDTVAPDELRETIITTLQRVDERTEAEDEAETVALLASPQHMNMAEAELIRALQSDRDGGQESGTDARGSPWRHYPAGADRRGSAGAPSCKQKRTPDGARRFGAAAETRAHSAPVRADRGRQGL